MPTTEETTTNTLSAATHMGAITLNVGNLKRISAYYEEALGLTPIEDAEVRRERRRVLGHSTTPLVRLVETPDLPAWNGRQAGLFHTAFLYQTQQELAVTVARAAQHPESRYVGSADHLVSEAFYFTDPEGNGIELYWDRPRSEWPRRGGQVIMDTLPLDPRAYLRSHLPESAHAGAGKETGRIGHVHLQVGDTALAREFYVGQLGFGVTNDQFPQALFASAGGYHHHVAMNTWNSRGTGPRAATLGLGNVAVTVPGRADLNALTERLRSTGQAATLADDGASLTVRDPWGTAVTVSTPEAERDVDYVLGR